MQVPDQLMQTILNYLVTKPFIEVNQLVQEILKLKDQNGLLNEQETPVSDK